MTNNAIQNEVLQIYRTLNAINYPIIPKSIIGLLQIDTRIMSYQTLSKISGASLNDIIVLSNSYDGISHFIHRQNRCLILYNDTPNKGRVLWTLCHEIGHVALNHFELLEKAVNDNDKEIAVHRSEREADYFAWNLIAPLPIVHTFQIKSSDDLCHIFGMSQQASEIHYNRYIRWSKKNYRTAFDKDIIKEFNNKYVG